MSLVLRFLNVAAISSFLLVGQVYAENRDNLTNMFLNGLISDLSEGADAVCGAVKNPQCSSHKCKDSKGDAGNCMITIDLLTQIAKCECVTSIGGDPVTE